MPLTNQQMRPIAIAVLVVVIAMFLVDAADPDMRDVFSARGKVIQTPSAMEGATATCPGVDQLSGADAPVVLTFPMRWDPNVGEFIVSFSIGGAAIQAVPDTGSEYIIVASQACKNCDSAQGVINSDSSTAVDTGTTNTVRYGSQTDNLEWLIDDFSTGESQTARIEFGSIQSATVATGGSLNIIGLASSTSYAEKTPFIDQLVCTQQITLPYMYFDFVATSQVLVIGQPHPNAAAGSIIPYFDSTDLQKDGINMQGLNYYFLKPNQFVIGGTPITTIPKYCMFDTGTTMFTVPSGVSEKMLAQEGKTMMLDFGNFKLPYVIDRGTLDVDDSFGTSICIIGNQNMLDNAWSFDINQKTLTII